MLKHIAVRLKKFSDGEAAFSYKETHTHKRQLVESRLEARDPALRNITEALFERGLKYSVDGCSLYWFQVDDDNTVEYYQECNEVECVFSSDWFEEEKKKIRYYQGIKYVDECYGLAEQFTLKCQERPIDYQVQRLAA